MTGSTNSVTQVLLADPALTSRTAGQEFGYAVAASPHGDVEVPLRVSLPATFPLAKTRPRYTVRHLVKVATVTGESVRYVREARAGSTTSDARAGYAGTPEAGFLPELREAKLTELTARVAVPDGLTGDPALLGVFCDHRVVVRLCTVENEALLRGTSDGTIAGLLRLDGLRQVTATGDLATDLGHAAAEVEEMGGSCDGIVTHPEVYWTLATSGLLGRLAEAGVRVSRTRMIGSDQLLFGDFRAAATLLDPASSTLRLLRSTSGPVIEATVRVGFAVHLPQHLLLMRVAR